MDKTDLALLDRLMHATLLLDCVAALLLVDGVWMLVKATQTTPASISLLVFSLAHWLFFIFIVRFLNRNKTVALTVTKTKSEKTERDLENEST